MAGKIKEIGKQDKGTTEWSKSVETNGITKRVKVEKVDGGYIIIKSTYGHDNTKKNTEYIDETNKSISTENPLAGTTKDATSSILESIKELSDLKSAI